MNNFSILIAQINTTVGDIAGNLNSITKILNNYKNEQDSLIVFPELSLTGYPPEDLVLNANFMGSTENAIEKIKEYSKNYEFSIILGCPVRYKNGIANSAAFIYKGNIKYFHKNDLPNYGVF